MPHALKPSPRGVRVAEWHASDSLPLEGKVPPKGADEVSPRPGASASFVSDGPISSNSGRNGGKNAGRNCVSALPQRATVGCDFPHLLAGITFHHRCRSKGLCLHSFPLPLPVTTVKIIRSAVSQAKKSLYTVPNGHTYSLRCFAPQWARFDNRHSTSAPTPTLAVVSGSGARGTSDP